MTDYFKYIIIDVQINCISTDYFLYEVYKLLSIKLAEQIVSQTAQRLHHNINVFSTDGVILASKDKERVDSIHEGALQVVQTGKTLLLTAKDAQKMHNCKPGINLPIHFHDQIIGVIGITGNPDELGEIANLVQLTTEMLVHQVLSESKREWQRKNGDFIFKALIDTAPIGEEIEERIHKLPFKMTGPYQIILLQQTTRDTYTTFELHLENVLYRRAALFGQTTLNEYYIFLSGDAVHHSDQIVAKLQKLQAKFHIVVGVGPVVDELDELPYAFKSAKTTLQFNKGQAVTYFHQIEMHTLFKRKSSYEVAKFVTKIEQLPPKLRDTLQAFFICSLQLNSCADFLQIHRHTLKYRLNKVHELTGYDPHNFDDAFVLKLALMLSE